MTGRPCKDCVRLGLPLTRDAKYPGPRCATHDLVERRRQKDLAHTRRLEKNFGIDDGDYRRLHQSQGGKCFICRRATGKTKRLAVDHDHHAGCGHHPKLGCPKCIRALLCGPCNQLIGRYGPDALRRAIEVLTDPPARKVLEP
jgi:hypothetical protein